MLLWENIENYPELFLVSLSIWTTDVLHVTQLNVHGNTGMCSSILQREKSFVCDSLFASWDEDARPKKICSYERYM